MENGVMRNIDGGEELLLGYLRENRVQAKDPMIQNATLSKSHVVKKLIYNSKLTKFLVWSDFHTLYLFIEIIIISFSKGSEISSRQIEGSVLTCGKEQGDHGRSC